ncbi:hypothetical protein HDU76_004737 [Blyttiomyces sp. JEL0837]|nr:hypothetical protein HDU76_004737 [Blyttiomyces sp. JEL0837]
MVATALGGHFKFGMLTSPMTVYALAASFGILSDYKFQITQRQLFLIQREISKSIGVDIKEVKTGNLMRILKSDDVETVNSVSMSGLVDYQTYIHRLATTISHSSLDTSNSSLRDDRRVTTTTARTTTGTPTATATATATVISQALPSLKEQGEDVTTINESANHRELPWRKQPYTLLKQSLNTFRIALATEFSGLDADELDKFHEWLLPGVRFYIRETLLVALITNAVHIPLDLQTYCSEGLTNKSPSLCLDYRRDYKLMKMRIIGICGTSLLIVILSLLPWITANMHRATWFFVGSFFCISLTLE